MAQTTGRREFAVIGLGRFGSSLALNLMGKGCHVLGIDIDRELVQQFADELTHTIALDATDEEALRAVDITSFDTVIVAIGTNFESNILTTVGLKRLGVARVICKAISLRQAEVLRRVGADLVVQPEIEAGQRLAEDLVSPAVLASMVLGPGLNVAEINLPPSLAGRTVAQARLRERFDLTLLVVQSAENTVIWPPDSYTFKPGDVLVVIGSEKSTDKFSESV